MRNGGLDPLQLILCTRFFEGSIISNFSFLILILEL
jgi:hypothetical protein